MLKMTNLPLKYQVMFGAGDPSAVQVIVASFPSSAVRLAGGWIRIGIEAENTFVRYIRMNHLNSVFFNKLLMNNIGSG